MDVNWQYFVENFQFVNIFWAFMLPVALEIIDFLTGYINAVIRNEKDSAVMRRGGGKKFAEAMCLLVTQLFTWAMGLPHAFLYVVSLYICWMELVSIIENMKLLGMVIPGKVDDEIDHINDELKPREDKGFIDESTLDIEHSADDGRDLSPKEEKENEE